jgi:hypothetical protein
MDIDEIRKNAFIKSLDNSMKAIMIGISSIIISFIIVLDENQKSSIKIPYFEIEIYDTLIDMIILYIIYFISGMYAFSLLVKGKKLLGQIENIELKNTMYLYPSIFLSSFWNKFIYICFLIILFSTSLQKYISNKNWYSIIIVIIINYPYFRICYIEWNKKTKIS